MILIKKYAWFMNMSCVVIAAGVHDQKIWNVVIVVNNSCPISSKPA